MEASALSQASGSSVPTYLGGKGVWGVGVGWEEEVRKGGIIKGTEKKLEVEVVVAHLFLRSCPHAWRSSMPLCVSIPGGRPRTPIPDVESPSALAVS